MDVLQAVDSVTQNARVRASMLLGSWLESGQNPGAVGDNGTSFGPWQIHTPVHPDISSAQAENPAAAAAYMEPAYANAVAGIPDALWQSNPQQAAEEAAYAAEAPSVDYYTSAGSSAVGQAWQKTLQELSGQDLSSTKGFSPLGGPPATTTSSTGSPNAQDAFSLNPLSGVAKSFDSFTNEVKKLAIQVPAIGVGAVMIILGLSRATGFKPNITPALAAAAL